MRRSAPPGRRAGLPPVATALVVAAVALVAAGVGLFLGSGGFESDPAPPAPPPAATASSAHLPSGESDPDALDRADDGAAVFRERCAPCHTIGEGPKEGPDLARVALRSDPAWVRALVRAPDSMFVADSAARRLLDIHGLTVEDVASGDPEMRALLAFLRTFDRGG